MKKMSFTLIIISILFLIGYYYSEQHNIHIIQESSAMVESTARKLGDSIGNQNPEEADHYIIPVINSHPNALLGEWVFESFQRKGKEVFVPQKEGLFTIKFDTENRITGTTDCNNYFTSYTQVDFERIDLDKIMSTRMMCSQSEETKYLAYLSQVYSYSFEDGKLQLIDTQDGSLTYRLK